MAAFDSLKPDAIVKPLQDGIDSAVNAVFSAIPIDDTFHEVDEALAKVQDAAAIGDRFVSVLQRVHDGAGGLRRRARADGGVARADPAEGRRGRGGRVAHAPAERADDRTRRDEGGSADGPGRRGARSRARAAHERRPALEALGDRPRQERRLARDAERAARLAREDGSRRRARPLRPALGRLHAAVRVAPQPRARARGCEDRRPRAARRRLGRELHRARRRAPDMHGLTAGPAVGQSVRDMVEASFADAAERGLRADRAAGHGGRRDRDRGQEARRRPRREARQPGRRPRLPGRHQGHDRGARRPPPPGQPRLPDHEPERPLRGRPQQARRARPGQPRRGALLRLRRAPGPARPLPGAPHRPMSTSSTPTTRR